MSLSAINILTTLFLVLVFGFLLFADVLRKQKIAEYCKEKGLIFNEESNSVPYFDDKFKLSINKIGVGFYFSLMYGEHSGIKYTIFDYCYGITKRRRNKFTVCMLTNLNVKIPQFQIRNKEYSFLSFNNSDSNIIFDEDKEFSEMFVVDFDDSFDLERVKIFLNQRVRKVLKKIKNNYYEFEATKKSFIIFTNGWVNIHYRIKMINDALELYDAMKAKD